MIATTPRFLTALRQSHTVAVRATLYRPSAPTTPISCQVVGGQVTSDVDAHVRRQGTLEVAFSLADPVTISVVRELPFGGYAVVERGLRYADGGTEFVQLGRFRIEAVTWPDEQGRATLTLADRMAQIADESFTTPYSPAGLKPSDAIVALINGVFGSSIAYHVTTTPATESPVAEAIFDEDRAAAISDLAAGIGAEAFFDNLGDFVLRPKPDTSGEPVYTFAAGSGGVLVGGDESLDRSSVRNGVAVRATPDPTLPPIYSLATDADPASPTRWGGPFGRVPLIVNSTSITTQAQADSTAASLLNLRLGLSRTLELHGVPNPALEVADLVEVIHSDGRTETTLINALRIPLDAEGALDLTTRANWRPVALAPPLIRRYSGPAAMRELDEAAA